MKVSTLLHLRFPFSFFLLPVFLFAASVVNGWEVQSFITVFFILHFLLYPASNGYNSFFDRDEKSIGGLRNPPGVTRELYWVALGLDAIAILWSTSINPVFGVMILVYGLVSKMYSHPSVRLKKYPVLGWLAAGFFQGYFTFLMTVIGLKGEPLMDISKEVHYAGLLSSLLLFGSYPMTQVYQHEEDSNRGDITMSIKLGILGTFHFTAICFSISTMLFFLFYQVYVSMVAALIFLVAMTPIVVYFGRWYFSVRKDQTLADYDHTMRLNLISSACLNVFFLMVMVSNSEWFAMG